MKAAIQTKPVPTCPDCKGPMNLHEPDPDDRFGKPFWGCATRPACIATYSIGPDGKPVYEEQAADLTFRQALDNLLQQYDDEVARMRSYLADRGHVNDESDLMVRSSKRICEITKDIFDLKSMWKMLDVPPQ